MMLQWRFKRIKGEDDEEDYVASDHENGGGWRKECLEDFYSFCTVVV